MKYRNNIVYYIWKTYEVEEKNKRNKKINTSLVSNYDLYTISLKNLKSVCDRFNVNTPEKLDVLIIDLEKEISSKEKSDEKKAKMISSIIALFGTPCISLLSDWAKTDVNSLVLVLMFLAEIVIMFFAVWMITDEISSHFSKNVQYKRLSKMLRDIKLLHYFEGTKIDE